jgi:hypothetical protein
MSVEEAVPPTSSGGISLLETSSQDPSVKYGLIFPILSWLSLKTRGDTSKAGAPRAGGWIFAAVTSGFGLKL